MRSMKMIKNQNAMEKAIVLRSPAVFFIEKCESKILDKCFKLHISFHYKIVILLMHAFRFMHFTSCRYSPHLFLSFFNPKTESPPSPPGSDPHIGFLHRGTEKLMEMKPVPKVTLSNCKAKDKGFWSTETLSALFCPTNSLLKISGNSAINRPDICSEMRRYKKYTLQLLLRNVHGTFFCLVTDVFVSMRFCTVTWSHRILDFPYDVPRSD